MQPYIKIVIQKLTTGSGLVLKCVYPMYIVQAHLNINNNQHKQRAVHSTIIGELHSS